MTDELWSSFDPLSIPLDVRRDQLKQGNIVPNGSFEYGKTDAVHQPVSSFSLEGWRVVGEGVEWVDSKSIVYAKGDVSFGRYAIRISRKRADETDEIGSGVESDFIPVIPGNYGFTYDVKLQDIYPARGRFGTRLYDAIDIRLLFFDKNKEPIDGEVVHPHYKITIDNSFKGFTFSNFWHIGKFGWENVLAGTFNYPFSEGDIPDNCRFIKLFLGLKGTGTMWIDNVSFKYSRWNFTSLERVSPFFDFDLSITDSIIPAPKQIGSVTKIECFTDAEHKPMIIAPEHPGAATDVAVTMLRQTIEEVTGAGIEVVTKMSPELWNSGRLIFSVGRTSMLDEFISQLPYAEIAGRDQGYFVARIEERIDNHENVVFLAGNTDIGDYYAVTTAVQLIDRHERTFHFASIVDFPDFIGRSFRLRTVATDEDIDHNLLDIERLSALKLNKIYSGYEAPGKDWLHPPKKYFDSIKAAGRKCRDTGVVQLAVQVNPYYHFEFMAHVADIPEEQRGYWLHYRPEDIEKLKERIRFLCECGAECLMLLSDDFVPHEEDHRMLYSLWNQEDRDEFTNLQNAHAYMINEIHSMLAAEYPGCRIEFCPPWYNNSFIDRSRGYAEQYFRDLVAQIPEDVAIIWTGNTVRSLSIDSADIERYRELIGRYPMLFDNTLYARRSESSYGGYAGLYPGKVRMCSVFEPYDIRVPQDFHRYNSGGHLYQNGGSDTEFGKIQYATVADYEWNTARYDPDRSLWKTLCTQYGRQTAIHLLEFNDIYYGFVDMKMRIEREGKSDDRVAKAREYSLAVDRLLSILCGEIPEPNREIIDELGALRENMDATQLESL